jgi:hypothetical protein
MRAIGGWLLSMIGCFVALRILEEVNMDTEPLPDTRIVLPNQREILRQFEGKGLHLAGRVCPTCHFVYWVPLSLVAQYLKEGKLDCNACVIPTVHFLPILVEKVTVSDESLRASRAVAVTK